jgi:hypothetical protein
MSLGRLGLTISNIPSETELPEFEVYQALLLLPD